MALSTTANKVILNGNGVTTVWPYTFPIPDAASLLVYYTDILGVQTLLSASQYTVTGLGTTAGGNVTYPLGVLTPIATGTKLTIARIVDYTQSTVFTNQGGYYPAVTEARFDRVMMAVQQLADSVGRALVAPVSDSNPTALPTAAQRANTALLFDASGNPYAGTIVAGTAGASPYMTGTFFPLASAAAVRDSLGAIAVVRTQTFTASGTYTPHPKMVYAFLETWGPGGGGGASGNAGAALGGSGGGGGAGSNSSATVTAAQIGASKAVTIGPAGAGGAAGNNAGAAGGSNTSVGALCIATPGQGGAASAGTANATALGGLGGVAGTGDTTGTGAPGAGSAVISGVVIGNNGGSTSLGGGGLGGASTAGGAATGFGGGGAGGSSFNSIGSAAGGNGKAGYVRITEYCTS